MERDKEEKREREENMDSPCTGTKRFNLFHGWLWSLPARARRIRGRRSPGTLERPPWPFFRTVNLVAEIAADGIVDEGLGTGMCSFEEGRWVLRGRVEDDCGS